MGSSTEQESVSTEQESVSTEQESVSTEQESVSTEQESAPKKKQPRKRVSKESNERAALIFEPILAEPAPISIIKSLLGEKTEKGSSRVKMKPSVLSLDPAALALDADSFRKKLRYQIPILLALVAVLSSLLTFTVSNQFRSDAIDQTSFVAKISGGVALTEDELRVVVKQLGRTVYWAGPLKDAKYTINGTSIGQTYIRYLPNGQGVNDTAAKYRVIATYEEKDAYTSTLAAGNEANGVSFTTAEGKVIHYNKTSKNNIYLAYQGQDYQVEVFDPSDATALNLATDPNQIRIFE